MICLEMAIDFGLGTEVCWGSAAFISIAGKHLSAHYTITVPSAVDTDRHPRHSRHFPKEFGLGPSRYSFIVDS